MVRIGHMRRTAYGSLTPCGSRRLSRFIHIFSAGVVTTVLAMAINTSMVNTDGGMMPRSRPTLMTTSYISARVFIMMPIALASRASMPERLAAK